MKPLRDVSIAAYQVLDVPVFRGPWRSRASPSPLVAYVRQRPDNQRDLLLLIDNIFRFIKAGMEVSGLMGQMSSRLGYQPTMGNCPGSGPFSPPNAHRSPWQARRPGRRDRWL
jgi:hypothetical protein